VGKMWERLKYEHYLMIIMINEQIYRGEFTKLSISSILVRSIEESEKKVFEIPSLKYCKIKEKIFESYIKGKIKK
jgi:hypothetical protein